MAQATVSIRLGNDYSNVKLAVSTSADLSNPIYSSSQSSANKTVKITIDGLLDNTLYHYGVMINNTLQTKGRGQFKTFIPKGAGNFTCAFASCAFTGSEHEVFTVIRNHNPDIFIHMGDLHYADITANNRDLYRKAYDDVFASVKQSTLYSQIPTAYIWDDHDYGNNNSNKNNPGKEAAALTYRERVPHYELPTGNLPSPIYQSFVIGRVRFIMTDLRFMKEPPTSLDNELKTMMGETQIQWFFKELVKPEPLKIWVCSKPWIGVAKESEDYWASYTYERNRIANFIKENNLVGRVAIISGDMHGLAIDDGTNSDYATGGGAPIPIFQAAQLDQNPSSKGGPWTSGAAFTSVDSGQFGIMNINDDGTNPISVEWVGKRLNETLTSLTFTAPSSEYVAPAPTPEDITNLSSSNVRETSLDLTWSESSSDNVYQYLIYQDGILKGTTHNSFYNITGLNAGLEYEFKVVTENAYGVFSPGAIIRITTVSEIIFDDLPSDSLVMRIDANVASSLSFGSDEKVSEIADLSGNNNNLIAETGTHRPDYIPDSQYNNKPIISFLGKRLGVKPMSNTFNGNITVVMVACLHDYNGTASERFWTLGNSNNTDYIGLHRSANGTIAHRYVNTNGQVFSMTGQERKLAVFTSVLTPNSSKLYKNDDLITEDVRTNNNIGIFNFLLPYSHTANTTTNLDLAEIAIYDREISGVELERAIKYLKSKWGIA